MLIPKKISKKKLILYFIIMATMISGTGFLLYENCAITSKKAFVTDMPAMEMPIKTTSTLIAPLDEAEIKNKIKTATSTIPTSKSSQVLDISIFSNNKFQSLRENIISQPVKIERGRGNPFEPY